MDGYFDNFGSFIKGDLYNHLGSFLNGEKTIFSVWAPNA